MKVCLINQENLQGFRSLLLPAMAAEMEAGGAVLALGLVQEEADGLTACGAAAGWAAENRFEIHSFYIAPAYRRQGGGQLLLDTLCGLVQSRCAVVQMSFVLTDAQEHTALLPFLEKNGFIQAEEREKLYGISLRKLGESAFFASAKSDRTNTVVPFTEVSPDALKQAYLDTAARKENYLPYALTDARVDADVSMAVMHGGKVRSFVAFVPQGEGVLSLAWVESETPADMPVMLRTAFVRVCKKYAAETLLTVHGVQAAAEKLITTLMPQAEQISYTFMKGLEG